MVISVSALTRTGTYHQDFEPEILASLPREDLVQVCLCLGADWNAVDKKTVLAAPELVCVLLLGDHVDLDVDRRVAWYDSHSRSDHIPAQLWGSVHSKGVG